MAEIERCAGDPAFGHVRLFGRTGQAVGNRRYFPIFEAAVAAGLPGAEQALRFTGNPNPSSGLACPQREDLICAPHRATATVGPAGGAGRRWAGCRRRPAPRAANPRRQRARLAGGASVGDRGDGHDSISPA